MGVINEKEGNLQEITVYGSNKFFCSYLLEYDFEDMSKQEIDFEFCMNKIA